MARSRHETAAPTDESRQREGWALHDTPDGIGYLPQAMSRRGMRWLERLALVTFGLLVAAVALEAAMQIGAFFVGAREVRPGGAVQLTILCLGDSHTYGVHFPAGEAYPGQLQALLDQRASGRYRVLNLGLPGMNSSEIASRLPVWLEEYRPYAVVVAAGLNNVWNRSETSRRFGWLYRLRLVRLAELIEANFRARLAGGSELATRPEFVRELKEDGEAGEEYRDARTGQLLIAHQGNIRHMAQHSLPVADARALLRRDLARMLEATGERGVKLALLTYTAFPLPGQPQTNRFAPPEQMNEEMREFSRQHGVVLVDARERFLQLLAGAVRRSMFFMNDTEDHPNPRGYAEIARLVADAFEPPAKPDG